MEVVLVKKDLCMQTEVDRYLQSGKKLKKLLQVIKAWVSYLQKLCNNNDIKIPKVFD